jgi:xanthine dehydrogenase YagS FAD-binding subunit
VTIASPTYPGDFAQALIALDASVEIWGASGRRNIPFEQLHRLPGDTPDIQTSLSAEDLITAFEISWAPWMARSLYLKIRDRQSYEFALASAAVGLDVDNDTVREVRIALGGVATKPWRAREAEAALAGKVLSEASIREAANVAFAGAQPRDQNGFRVELGRRTLMRALLDAQKLKV